MKLVSSKKNSRWAPSLFSAVTLGLLAYTPACLAHSISMHGGSHFGGGHIGGVHCVSKTMHVSPHNFGGDGHGFHNAEHNSERAHETGIFRHEEFRGGPEHNFARHIGHENLGREHFNHNGIARRDSWGLGHEHNFDHREIARQDGWDRGHEHRHLGDHNFRHDQIARREYDINPEHRFDRHRELVGHDQHPYIEGTSIHRSKDS